MNRERDIARNAFIFTAGRIAAQLAGFLLLPLYSALLTPEDFGIADLINTLVFLIIPFVGIQMDTALFRYMVDSREDKAKQKELFSTVIVVNLIQIVAYAVIFFIARPFITLKYKDFLLLNVILVLLVNSFLQFMRGLGKNLMYSAAVFITSFSGLILNVVLVTVVRIGVTGIIISSAASQFLTLLFACIAVKPWKYFSFKKFSKGTAKMFFKYSFPLIPNQLAWWVMGISDRLVISGTLGVAANGIYSLANRFSSIFTSVSDSINLSWTESTSLHIDEEDRNEYITGMIDRLFVLFASGCFVFLSLIPFAFVLINKDYSDSYMQIPILMMAVLCQGVVGIYSAVLIALKKTKSIAVTSIIAAAVNLLIDIVSVKTIGIYAGSISTFAAFFLLAAMRCVLVKHLTGIRPKYRIMIPVTFWGSIVVICFYLRNPKANFIALILSVVVAFIANFKIVKMAFTMCKNKISQIKHNKRRNLVYGKMEQCEGETAAKPGLDLTGNKELSELLIYKDESWNYINKLSTYRKYLAKRKMPHWEDNVCGSGKYEITGDTIKVRTDALPNNWLCFYIDQDLPECYEISYDIAIENDFTEIQIAFNYVDLGNRYRFMIKDNKTCRFEAVYDGDFLEPFKEIPFSISHGEKHNIRVKVLGNKYAYFVDGNNILSVEEKGERIVDGDRACLILWNETDESGINCEISNITVRSLEE
ncbi:MAG: lipopolysaccharide biosynthesis protein [Clostridiales bacterium]|nr:lipopolysaccharide biosynthesis protein [Clostridiales bacterium]